MGIAAVVPKAGPRNYAYYTEPQPSLNGRRSYQPRGRGLGGSSSINGMVYIRGHRRDYDDWAALGCRGWGFDDVLPCFRRSERNPRLAGQEHPLHGNDGPLHVSDLARPIRLRSALSRQRSRPACLTTTTSMATARKASACTR